MNVLLLTSHAIAEHDDLEMFTRMGVPVYSIGGAYDEVPFEGKRPAIPGVIRYPELEEATNRQRAYVTELRGDPGPNIDWGKAQLAPEVIRWADTIIVHHFPESWIGGQWAQIRHKRVIWRTCGQSDPRLEYEMYRYRRAGMQIVRYSPKEAIAFTEAGAFAGEDAMIRFGKDPDEWYGWLGPSTWIGNVTQKMVERHESCGETFYREATKGLPARPAGEWSEQLPDGVGQLAYADMKLYLRAAGVYLYTGTRPASYTLGLIEAMMTGVPTVSIDKASFGCGDLFEGDEISGNAPLPGHVDPVRAVHDRLAHLLREPEAAKASSAYARRRAIELFGLDKIMGEWAEFLA